MGLVRTTPGSMGWDGLCAARHVAPLEPDTGGAGRVDGPGPSHRGHGRRAARLGGTHAIWRTDRLATVIVRARGTCRRASPRWPSTTERSSSPVRRGAATAKGRSRRRSATPRAGGGAPSSDHESRGGPTARLDRFLRWTGRRPTSAAPPRARRRRSASWPTPSRCWTCRRCRSRPPSPSSGTGRRQRHGRLPGQPLLGAAGTVRGRPSSCDTGWRLDPWRSMPLRELSWSPTGWPPLGRDRRAHPRAPGRLESVVLVQLHHGPARATPRPTGHRGPSRLAEAARLLGAEGREVTVDLQGYADLVEGDPMSDNSALSGGPQPPGLPADGRRR